MKTDLMQYASMQLHKFVDEHSILTLRIFGAYRTSTISAIFSLIERGLWPRSIGASGRG
jgi:hypothetical protein